MAAAWILILYCAIFQIVVGEVYLNSTSEPLKSEIGDEGNAEKNRPKRNHLTNNLGGGSAPGSVEGLLASCQLTNLLLYQLLQQQSPNAGHQFPSLGGNPQNVPQPFPAAAGLVNNFLFPPRLTTYVTTSTYTMQTTSSTIITIPLLFGNKPSPTTITRTKIYDITTSDVQTITTTVEPSTTTVTPTATVYIEATKSQAPAPHFTSPAFQNNFRDEVVENDIDFQNLEQPPRHSTPFLKFVPNPVDEQLSNPNFAEKAALRTRRKNQAAVQAAPSTKPPRVAVRKVLRTNPGTPTDSFSENSSPAYRYGPESYGTKNFKQSAREFKQSPREFKQSPRDYSRETYLEEPIRAEMPQFRRSYPSQEQYRSEEDKSYAQNYYSRRLKRRGEVDVEDDSADAESFHREFLLEPSFNAEVGVTTRLPNELTCPPPLEITVTKTITKFVNPPPAASAPFVAENVLAPSRVAWKPSTESRHREARKFQPTKAYTVPQVSSSPEIPVQSEEIPASAPKSNRGRGRGGGNVPATENSPTAPPQTATPSRRRFRGDILDRARVQPTPTPAPSIPDSNESAATGELSSERGRQRRRQRRPTPEANYVMNRK